MIFRDRTQAGQRLAQKLRKYEGARSVVLALPRGGVPVAYEIAKTLNAPLDVLLVRKIGAPFQPELAVGALCEDEGPIWNAGILARMGLAPEELGQTIRAEADRMARQKNLFREGREFPSVIRKTAIVVDDGLATGATMAAAVGFLRNKGATKIVVAVPVAAASSAGQLRDKVDDLVILEEREDLMSVGQWYHDFSQTTDDEVLELLGRGREVRIPAHR